MSESDSLPEVCLSKNEIKTANAITSYIFELSKELNIEDTNGVLGNELELIALVRNCQFLYDKSKPDFKDVTKKILAWEAIATVMHSNSSEVQLRWRNLREAYNKHKKELELNKDNQGAVKTWEFYEDMKFIEPHIIHRRPAYNKLKTSFTFSYSDTEELKDDLKFPATQESIINEQPLDILQLISLIEDRPILYNSKHPEYRNKSMKQQAWNEIAQAFGIPALECEVKWKALRERYGRERKMQHLGGERRHWEFFDALLFLDSHVKPRRQSLFKTSFSKVSPDSSNKISMVNVSISSATGQDTALLVGSELLKTITIPSVHEVEDIQHVEFVDTSNPMSSKTPSPTIDDNKISMRNIHLSPASPISNHVMHDEDDLFGQTIAAELRRLPSGKKKMKIKADMYRLLYENESD